MTTRCPLFLFILLCIFAASCGEKKELRTEKVDLPSDSIIPAGTMTLILGDAHIIEAALLLERNTRKEVAGNKERLYAGLFAKYRISRGRYDANLRYYRQQPELMLKMYDRIIDRLTIAQHQLKPGQ